MRTALYYAIAAATNGLEGRWHDAAFFAQLGARRLVAGWQWLLK